MIASLLGFTVGLLLVLLLRRPVAATVRCGPRVHALAAAAAAGRRCPCCPCVPATWQLLPTVSVGVGSGPRAVALEHRLAAARCIGWRSGWLEPAPACCVWRVPIAGLRASCAPAAGRPARAMPANCVRRSIRAALRLHASGPAVLWAPRSLVLLPADFLRRFDRRPARTDAGARGDPPAPAATRCGRLLAELACAVLWFHPLAWLALPRFRLDQELACDERVLAHGSRGRSGTMPAPCCQHRRGSRAGAHPLARRAATEGATDDDRTSTHQHAAPPSRGYSAWPCSSLQVRLTRAGRGAGYRASAIASQDLRLQRPDATARTQRHPSMNKEQGTVVLQVRVSAGWHA